MSTLRFVTTWGYNPDSRGPKLRYGKHFRHLSKALQEPSRPGVAPVTAVTGAARADYLMRGWS